MRIGICEDDGPVAALLKKQIEIFFDKKGLCYELETYPDGASMLADPEGFDLVFLDCRLPDMNGLEVAAKLGMRDEKPVPVFISAYSEYVFKSFEVGAFRYLVKPINEAELGEALTAFLKGYKKDIVIEIPVAGKKEYLRASNIVYIESERKFSIVRFYTEKDATVKFYESKKSLSQFMQVISGPDFFRTHKRYLVNLKYISRIENGVIYLSVGEQVEISRRNLTQFNKAYNEYLKNTF
ncbi:MAG: response regulator transcription factor [Clostridia bacterium]|nr:response regulator transcription factor [Clostridia bacterium]